jgi:hypothetical protein
MIPAAVIASVALSLFAGVPAAADPPPQGQITIEKLAVNGSGCRPATVATAISPDNQAFTVTYSEYVASIGPGIKAKEAHKDCKITLRLNVPAGITYAVARADYRGFGVLQPGVVGTQTAAYSFQGVNDPVVSSRSRTGPWDENWQFTDKPASPLFGPCGKDRKLRIDTDLTVTAGSKPITDVSVVGMDSTDGDFASTYKLAWKRC